MTFRRKSSNQMQEKRGKHIKKRAFTPAYVSPAQLTLEGFETPFEQKLRKDNRWVKLAERIPWDRIVPSYDQLFVSKEGRPPISGRVILGSLIIKHLGNLTDRETIAQIQENMYMQHFLGYSSYCAEAPFSASLFVEIRQRLSLELLGRINELIAVSALEAEEQLQQQKEESQAPSESKQPEGPDKEDPPDGAMETGQEQEVCSERSTPAEVYPVTNKGNLLVDATVAPQNITFPTDLKLLDAARRKSEELIDRLYHPVLHGKLKPRTYRQLARKDYLDTAKKKRKNAKEIYKANGRQLRYLRRNLGHIEMLLEAYEQFPLKVNDLKYLMVLHTVYEQQDQMYRSRSHQVEDRIVNIHQPHVRPIVRGKDKAKTEFGSKVHVALVSGFTFIDRFSWDAFNEGGYLIRSVEHYKRRFGYYPAQVHADQIYCSRENRRAMKERGIKLMAKPLGRPSAQAVNHHVRPGERNPIEGKFGQAKLKYGMDNIRAKLATTSASWVASIALVLNLVRLTRQAPMRLMIDLVEKMLSDIRCLCRKLESKYEPKFLVAKFRLS